MALTVILSPVAMAEPADKDGIFAAVLENNPRITAALARVRSAQGAHQQASVAPNPEASFELENFGGNDNLRGIDGVEATIGLQQEIEIAGKRQKRTELADYQIQIAQQQALAEALSLLAEADYTYMRLGIAQERVALAQKRVDLSQQTHDTVKNRVRAAAASDIQHTKADIELAAARLQLKRAEQELTDSHSALSALTNMATDIAVKVTTQNLPPLPDRQALLQSARNTPHSRAASLAQMQATKRFDLENVQGIPNPVLGIGIRHSRDEDNTSFIAGLSFALPVYNRNQGTIRQAQADIAEAEALSHHQNLMMHQNAAATWEKLNTAYHEVVAYDNDIVPSAQRAYQQASDGYRAGRFSFLDLLDAQRTLYEAQESRLNSLLTFYEAQAQANYLTGVYEPVIRNILNFETGE